MSIGNNRSFVLPFQINRDDNSINNNSNSNYIDINKKNDEELKSNYLVDLYLKDNLMKNRMLMTSLYKNKFSEYFDKRLGAYNFNYDMSKTLLVNKKKFEYSIFDNRYILTKNKNKSKSLPKKPRRKYTNILEMNKVNSVKHYHFKDK